MLNMFFINHNIKIKYYISNGLMMRSDVIKFTLDAVNDIGINSDWSTSDWTRKIKNDLCRLGKEQGFWVYASSCDESHEGEWLYDITWLNYDGEYIKNVELVVESEWDINGLNSDFQKLLIARSPMKLFIFQQANEVAADRMIANFMGQIEIFNTNNQYVSGDKYIFSCWLWTDHRFYHKEISL